MIYNCHPTYVLFYLPIPFTRVGCMTAFWISLSLLWPSRYSPRCILLVRLLLSGVVGWILNAKRFASFPLCLWGNSVDALIGTSDSAFSIALKDMNFQRKLHISPERRALLLEQLERDCRVSGGYVQRNLSFWLIYNFWATNLTVACLGFRHVKFSSLHLRSFFIWLCCFNISFDRPFDSGWRNVTSLITVCYWAFITRKTSVSSGFARP